MADYIWASVITGALGLVLFSWLMGFWPDWAYPPIMPDKVALIMYLGCLALFVGLISTSAVMVERARQYTPPCVAEDGGPLPCEFDGGVTENGYRKIIRFEPVE